MYKLALDFLYSWGYKGLELRLLLPQLSKGCIKDGYPHT